MNLQFSKTASWIAIVGLVTLSTAACGKDKGQPVDSAAATAAPAPAAGVSVSDVQTGRHLGPDKQVADKTSDFAPADTIYASVHTTGTGTGRVLAAKWTFENGTVVDERTETISPTGDSYTEFHIVKPGGWPKGTYTLHILLDGNEVRTADVRVK
jgi:hypothetical protein